LWNKEIIMETFSDKLTDLIGKYYDVIAKIVKDKAQESAYINENESVFSLILDSNSIDSTLFVHYTTSDDTNTKYYNDGWINQIDYHYYESCGNIILISEDGVEIPIEDINDSDVVFLTDYLIEQWKQ